MLDVEQYEDVRYAVRCERYIYSSIRTLYIHSSMRMLGMQYYANATYIYEHDDARYRLVRGRKVYSTMRTRYI